MQVGKDTYDHHLDVPVSINLHVDSILKADSMPGYRTRIIRLASYICLRSGRSGRAYVHRTMSATTWHPGADRIS